VDTVTLRVARCGHPVSHSCTDSVLSVKRNVTSAFAASLSRLTSSSMGASGLNRKPSGHSPAIVSPADVFAE
jgi:hypothetical protein